MSETNLKDIPDYKNIKADSEDDRVLPLSEVAKEERKSNIGIERFPIGFKKFDEAMGGGFAIGDFVIIGGRESQGKTSFAQTLTYHQSKQAVPCLWFSYETYNHELDKKFRNMGIDEDYLVYVPAKNTSNNLDWIKDKIKEGVAKYSTKVVFIDHIKKLVSESAMRTGNMNQFLGAIASELKVLALELEIVIVAMVHLNKLRGSIPTNEDIRDTSDIANEANCVMLIWRMRNEEKVSMRLSDDKTEDGDEEMSNESRIKMTKARPTGHTPIIKTYYKNDKFELITNKYNDEYTPD
jgi:replicative DNA helicase